MSPATDDAIIAPRRVVPLLVGSTMNDVERELIVQTLAHCGGNRTHAARVLGVSVRTLRNKIRQYAAEGMDVPEPS
jgi:DNA-binding NtrC family response regulator